jgi:hypothetical protein
MAGITAGRIAMGSTAETGGIETATEPSRAGTERRNVRLWH